jgi:ribosomal protein S18 acetylase RimI-like enzyme
MLPAGYELRQGTGLERALLVKFMQQTYQELYPDVSFAHLARTVEQYFSSETPLWWAEDKIGGAASGPVGCLWAGIATDQISGRTYPHIFLLYVMPEYRRQGIGSGLMQHIEAWAEARGAWQIGLQVFQQNQPALRLYEGLGFKPQSIGMIKPIGAGQS